MDNELADIHRKLGAGQPLVGTKPAMGISYSQIKECFLLGEDENNKAWLEAKVCRQFKTLIGEKQPKKWTAGLRRLNRCKAKN